MSVAVSLMHDRQESIIAGILVGRSLAIRRVRYRVIRLAQAPLPVLIEGPTGSGKELVAQALHALSGRPGRLVPFNVSAIGESMFEDSLFGHVRGAFTGATTDNAGYLMEAHRGTVFLDEISTLPPTLQGKLLRAVETREFRPVGARQDQHSDFRLVAATNENLGALAMSGRFREDLLYRIRGGVIRVPSLRERLEDVTLLAAHFARSAAGECGPAANDCDVPSFSDGAIELLESHEWRGNVRELRHVVELALVLNDGIPQLGAGAVEEALRDVAGSAPASAHESEREVERSRLVEMLERCQWNVREAAGAMGISKAHVYRRMRALGVPLRGWSRARGPSC